MFESQRQHPVAALTKALEIIRGNFITILFIIFVGGRGEQADFTLYWILGAIICLLIWGGISWFRFTFRVVDGELQIEQGVLIHKKLYLTADRIQVIDISSGPVQRFFGLVAVEVKTAGSTSKDATISALSREKAEELKALLRKKSPGAEDSEEAEPTEATEQNAVYTLTNRDLLIAATTSGRLGVAFSIVVAGFSQIDQLFTEREIYEFVEANIPHSTSLALVVMTIVGIFLLSWILSFISTIIKYYDFSVEVKDAELLITRGLFERSQLTIPFNRIQAVQIKEELLRQPLGYASLVIESAGYGESKGNSTTLFPLIANDKMHQFIDEVIPEYSVDPGQKPPQLPRRALRRYLFRMAWWALAFIALAWLTIPYGVYSWFILIPALLLGYRQYLDSGLYCADEDTLILSSRLLSKSTAIVKKYRMQAAEIKRNPFQERLDLSDFTIYVASGNQGRSFTVRELSRQQAHRHWQWLAKPK